MTQKKQKKVDGVITPENTLFGNDAVGSVVYGKSFKQYHGEVFGGKAVAWTNSSAVRGKEMAFLCLGHIKAKEPINMERASNALFNMGYIPVNTIQELMTDKQYAMFVKKLNVITAKKKEKA